MPPGRLGADGLPSFGETGDTVIADLANGTGRGHLKTGAPAADERVAKDNCAIGTEATPAAAGPGLPYVLVA